MTTEERKATDILLDLESKVDSLTNLMRSYDLNLKILSNKINLLLNPEQPKEIKSQNKPSVNAIVISPEDNRVPVETSPIGERRTSRPTIPSAPKIIKQEVKDPEISFSIDDDSTKIPVKKEITAIPIKQTLLDKNSKPMFMASVEIFDQHANKIGKTRTGANGVWSFALSPGSYKIVTAHKSVDGSNTVDSQNVNITGNLNPVVLPTKTIGKT